MHVRLELKLPRDASYVPLTRNVAGSILSELGVPDDAANDIRVVLSEACANVVRHATGTFDYSVCLAVGPKGCEVEVIDLGPGFEPPPATSAFDVDAEAGRGLFLMRQLVDDFQFVREQNATRVRLVKRWPNLGEVRAEHGGELAEHRPHS
jgi:serine/threonine-protein kinase RsbW